MTPILSNGSLWRVLLLALGVAAVTPLYGANERLLGQGDVVELNVYQQPDLNILARLGKNGVMNVPLLGEIELDGKSEREAERQIANLLTARKLVVNPQVSLFIQEYRSHQVSVMGHVNEPGRYAFESGDSIVDVIAMAGGFQEEAGGKVVLIRGNGQEDDVRQIALEAAMTTGGIHLFDRVEDGDVIFVPRMEVFYVYGEAQRPGAYRLSPDMSVMQALALAGSLTDKGSARSIRIRRRDESGALSTIKVELTDYLRPDDVIHVRESLF